MATPNQRLTRTNQGFTLVELIVVVAMLGVLAAIAAPSWLTLVTRQRLYDARANALDKVREAQSQALRTSRSWEACFRDRDGMVQVSVQPSGDNNNCANHTSWQPLLESGASTIAIKTGTPGTTSSAVFGTNPTIGYSFRFGSLGDTVGLGTGNPPQLVFIPRGQNNGPFYCVVAETIIGSVREGTIRSDNRCR